MYEGECFCCIKKPLLASDKEEIGVGEKNNNDFQLVEAVFSIKVAPKCAQIPLNIVPIHSDGHGEVRRKLRRRI